MKPSSTAAKELKKKGGGALKVFRNLIKRPKSPNDLASQSSSTDLLSSAVGQEDEISFTPTIAGQSQVSDWKAITKDRLGLASRFAQTLLKRVPECVDTNPVKVAFSIAKIIIEIKDTIGDNKDKLAQLLEDTANKLLAVERTVDGGVPKAAEKAMENLKSILGEQMKELMNLADKSLATQILDHEAYGPKIQNIFQRIKEGTMSFFFEMAISIQQTASEIRDDVKEIRDDAKEIRDDTKETHDDTKKAALERLRPSEKADHRTVLEEQGLKREVCTDGTRVKILEDITRWANDCSLASPRVFWLTGQAGSGKTTIAYTIARRFEEGGNGKQRTVLGGNFLCSRQFQETQAQSRILPTIAYQLAHKCESYANALHVANKFNAVNHGVSSQITDLLVGPWQLSEATRNPELPPYLIVIDALDEIKGDGGSAFLRDLLLAIDKYNLRGFKFLVTSRSDPKVAALCESFISEAVCRLQDVPIEEAKSDIETYLKTQLPELAGSPDFAELGRRAGGLFIYAATVVKYLIPLDSITAGEQTEMLNDFLSKSYDPTSSGDATFLIDELYRQIMCDAFSKLSGKFLDRRLRTLYTFLCTAERTSASVVAALILDGDDKAARAVLRDLHAVLYTQDDRVFWYHASFPDFIFTQTRSNFRIDNKNYTFSCNEPAHQSLLGQSCFSIMKSSLRFNMGNIKSSFLFDRDNAVELSEQVKQNISAVLRYASRYWTHHLPPPDLINTDNLRRCISEFLQIRVLFWIEAMNLLGLCNYCTPMLRFASQWVLKCGKSYSELTRDVTEAANFATYFSGSPAAESTPHLYISALATWSKETSQSRNWKNQFSRIPLFTCSRGNIDLPLMTVTVSTGGMIMDVMFSSDDMWIVSGSFEGSAQVWDASTGVKLKELAGSVCSIAISSDSTWIATSSTDNSDIHVWEVSTGVKLRELKGHTGRVHSLAFSCDGMRIVSGCMDSVRVWDVLTCVELMELKGEDILSVAFSSDGMRIVSASFYTVWVSDASTGVMLKKMEGHSDWVNSVAFSSDGLQIVSGSDDKSVRVWDALTGVELMELKGHTGVVNTVAFSNDGTWIVSGSDDQSVRVWDVSTGIELKQLKGHTKPVRSVAFSSDSTQIVSGSFDKSVRVWDASTSVELKERKGHSSFVTSVAFSSDGTQIVSGSLDKSVRVWDASTGVELKELKGHTEGVNSVAFSSDDMQIVSGSVDHSVRVWDTSTGIELKELKGHTKPVVSVAFSNNGTQIVSGSHDQSVLVWPREASTGVELKEIKCHTGSVHSVAFSSDCIQIVSGSFDGSVRVWDASTGVELKKLKGHTRTVNSVAFSSDGVKIVSGSKDNSVRVWDASTGVELQELKGHTDSVNSVAFSYDGMQIVSGSDDKSVRVWDASTGVILRELNGHTDKVNSVAFSSNGTKIVSGSDDNSVRIWDISMIDSEHFVWKLADNNWIMSSHGHNHLMWVPQEANLLQGFNVLIISCSGFVTVDFYQSLIGFDWVHCYTP